MTVTAVYSGEGKEVSGLAGTGTAVASPGTFLRAGSFRNPSHGRMAEVQGAGAEVEFGGHVLAKASDVTTGLYHGRGRLRRKWTEPNPAVAARQACDVTSRVESRI